MENAFTFLGKMLPFRNVTYQSGQNSRTIQAVRGGTSWNDINRVGDTGIRESNRDYIVHGEEFAIQKPRPKDKILDGEEVWTVYNLYTDECWRYVGQSQQLIRIHCSR